MTDTFADEKTPLDDDRLPWLEAVDEDEDSDGPSPMKLIVAVVIGLIAIGLVVGGLFWIGRHDGSANKEPELIAAEGGDYKVPPGNPGGMQVDGTGDTSFATSEGADTQGAINVDGVPEAPVTAAPRAPKPAPQKVAAAAPAPTPVRAPAAAPPAPRPAPATAGGATVQLGAFSSSAGASKAWKALSGRFAYLAPLSESVIPVTSGGRTLYRLRASGPNAANLCGRLRVAGETCVKID
jgi:hypothetical protein